MGEVCDFNNIGNDDDESLFGKTHHVTTCYPDLAGRTCGTEEVMASDYVYTTHYNSYIYPYNEHLFHTHYPPAFLANTALVIQTALLQDPANFYDWYFPNQINIAPSSYNIGNFDSILHYWFGIDSCDAGTKYPGIHYGWHSDRYYQGPADLRDGVCSHYFDYWVLQFLNGNHYWLTKGNSLMESDSTQSYYTAYPGNYYLPDNYADVYVCSRMDTVTETISGTSFPCAFAACNFACNGSTNLDC